jgi:creatinine amidohydrolase
MTDLADEPWPAVTPGSLVLVPTGSTEQHGPHLPFDTDTAIATEVTRRVASRLRDDGHAVVVAPALAFGASGEHQAFPGTVSIGTEALTEVLVELVRSIDVWAKRVVFVNGHGGNVPALRNAVAQMQAEGHDVSWMPCGTPGEDAHAGRAETSMMLAVRPAAVGHERPVGNTAPIGGLMSEMMVGGVRAVSENGVLGDARGASAEEGERMLTAIARSGVRRLDAASTDDRGCLRDPHGVVAP